MCTKICCACKLALTLSNFGKKAASKDGLQEKCKPCLSLYASSRRTSQAMCQLPLGTVAVDFGALVLSARTEKGLTQADVGAVVGVTWSQVMLWEKGRAIPTQKNMKKLAELLEFVPPLGVTANNEGRLPVGVADCEACGKPFPQYKARVTHCSKACMGKTQSLNQTGKSNPAWKDGTTSTAGGYIKVKAPGHPNADTGGYVLEHRLVKEGVLGRYLEKHERIHHKNGNRSDNSPYNLELWVGPTKKDPHGVRLVDKALDLVKGLTPEERLQVIAALAPA